MNAGKAVFIALVTGIATAAGTFFALQAATGGQKAVLTAVPTVAGLTAVQARQLLEAKDLRLAIFERRADRTQPKGRVIKQVPLPGSQIPTQSPVYVIISAGTSAGPSAAAPATPAASAAATPPATATPPPVAPAVPPPPVKPPVAPVAKPTPPVATPPVATEQVTVPSLVYASPGGAKKRLEKVGLTLGRRRTISDEDKRGGVVLRQNPRPGVKVVKGTAVDIWVNETD